MFDAAMHIRGALSRFAIDSDPERLSSFSPLPVGFVGVGRDPSCRRMSIIAQRAEGSFGMRLLRSMTLVEYASRAAIEHVCPLRIDNDRKQTR